MKRNKAVYSKWRKANLLSKHEVLRWFVPPTEIMTPSSLQRMLRKYNTVFVKPDVGALGRGVIQVKRMKKRRAATKYYFRIHEDAKVTFVQTFAALYNHLRTRAGGRRYVIQKGISLIKKNDKPIDFRIVVQKNLQRKWEVTGMIARVAHPQKVITNGSRGGRVLPIERVLAQYSRHRADQKRVLTTLHHLALRTAKQLGKSFPAQFEFGLDVAMTAHLKLWILEVNSKPDPRPFVKLKNQRPLRRMVKYGTFYGRKYNLVPKYKQKPV